jgi:hypothetical protein
VSLLRYVESNGEKIICPTICSSDIFLSVASTHLPRRLVERCLGMPRDDEAADQGGEEERAQHWVIVASSPSFLGTVDPLEPWNR